MVESSLLICSLFKFQFEATIRYKSPKMKNGSDFAASKTCWLPSDTLFKHWMNAFCIDSRVSVTSLEGLRKLGLLKKLDIQEAPKKCFPKAVGMVDPSV